MTNSYCPSCNDANSSLECEAAYRKLLAHSSKNSIFRRMNQLVVDSYALQHAKIGNESSSELASHLMTMYLLSERRMDPASCSTLKESMLCVEADFNKLSFVDPRNFTLSVLDVYETIGSPSYLGVLHRWSKDVWSGWSQAGFNLEVIKGWVEDWDRQKKLY